MIDCEHAISEQNAEAAKSFLVVALAMLATMRGVPQAPNSQGSTYPHPVPSDRLMPEAPQARAKRMPQVSGAVHGKRGPHA